jgi:nucleoside-triphosphatase THEP1
VYFRLAPKKSLDFYKKDFDRKEIICNICIHKGRTKMYKIYILTGGVHSGKTTMLQNRLKNIPNCDGLLAPIVNHRRCLVQISTNEAKLLENSNAKAAVQIGKHRLDQNVLDWGNAVLKSVFNKKNDWIVIDEIGYLELEGRGLASGVNFIINQFHQRKNFNLILIIREKILQKAIEYFSLREFAYFDEKTKL